MRFINLMGCRPGMILARDVLNANGITLLRAGSELKPSYLETLKKLGYKGCYIEDDFSKDVNAREAVSVAVRNEAAILVYELFSKSAFDKNTIQSHMLTNVKNILDDIVEQIISNRDAVVNVLNLKSFDQYTYQHSVDVAVLSVLIGKEMGLVRRELIELGTAAFFHDIGKMFISQAILNKPSSLTKDEFEEVKRHPQLGYDYLKNMLGMSEVICKTALYHHERFAIPDGYPSQITGIEIPLYARIVAVADTYDAITSKRPYKEAMRANEAYELIMGSSGSHFDPVVVNAFTKKIAPFPVGITVRLSNGKEGIVFQNHENFLLRPIIKVMDSPRGTLLDLLDPENLDITIDEMI